MKHDTLYFKEYTHTYVDDLKINYIAVSNLL